MVHTWWIYLGKTLIVFSCSLPPPQVYLALQLPRKSPMHKLPLLNDWGEKIFPTNSKWASLFSIIILLQNWAIPNMRKQQRTEREMKHSQSWGQQRLWQGFFTFSQWPPRFSLCFLPHLATGFPLLDSSPACPPSQIAPSAPWEVSRASSAVAVAKDLLSLHWSNLMVSPPFGVALLPHLQF